MTDYTVYATAATQMNDIAVKRFCTGSSLFNQLLICQSASQNWITLHRVSKNVPPLACYNFDAREWILIFLAEMLPIK